MAKIKGFKGHRYFAASYDFVTRWAERGVLARFRPLVAGEAKGMVLEIGIGTGANFPYYRHPLRLVAVDPDPFMLQRANKRANQLEFKVDLCQCPAEMLPFRDGAFDTVVSTLVLCTVQEPVLVLKEVGRVLKPTGQFRFIEHIRSSGFGGRVQDFFTPLWSRMAAGCHLNRKTVHTIGISEFKLIEVQEDKLGPVPLIVGTAILSKGGHAIAT